MGEEKMMILKMLEEGKIDAAEASKLLGTVGDAPSKPKRAQKSEKQTYEKDQSGHTYEKECDRHPGNNQNAPQGDFTRDLSKKFETFARDMEPKLQSFTKGVASAADTVADKISKTIGNTASAPYAREASKPPKPGYANTTERVFEYVVAAGYNELSLAGLNGDVTIQGYNGDKISAKIYYRAKKGAASIDIMRLGNKYFLNYEEDEFDKVCIDAYVPSGMFDSMTISTTNGALNVSAVSPANINIDNLNGATALKGVASENIKADCNNGALKLEDIKAANAEIESSNGNITALGADIKNLRLAALNGQINMNIAGFDAYDDYIWALETSNAKMTLNMPSRPDYGYHIKAHATFSNIKIGLTGLNYIINDSAFAEAKSVHYDSAAKQIRLSLETSNAPLVIN